jgi:hypothetical protein
MVWVLVVVAVDQICLVVELQVVQAVHQAVVVVVVVQVSQETLVV